MKWWTPTPFWSGRDAYIIGGGPSLEDFPWDVLKGKSVIGCNAAFLLGVGVCPVILFGDGVFFVRFLSGLEQYAKEGGIVCTTTSGLLRPPAPNWMLRLRKIPKGLALNAVGWNASTGAAAISLALLFGARRVFLLGFDMKANSKGKSHYHNAYNNAIEPETFRRFANGMKALNTELPKKFPGCEVVNLTEDSALGVFPKHSLTAHLEALRNLRCEPQTRMLKVS